VASLALSLALSLLVRALAGGGGRCEGRDRAISQEGLSGYSFLKGWRALEDHFQHFWGNVAGYKCGVENGNGVAGNETGPDGGGGGKLTANPVISTVITREVSTQVDPMAL